jgi:DNA-binding response OmpR family regulator
MDRDTHTILYIEDDPDFQEAVSTILEAGGFRVVRASSGEEGLRAYRTERPDAVLVDLMMEEVDAGIILIRELRAARENVPVMLLSSLGQELSQSKEYSQLGIAAVLQKPVKGDTLLALLRAALV